MEEKTEKLNLEVKNNEKKIQELLDDLRKQMPSTEQSIVENIQSLMAEIVTENVKKQSDNTNSLGLEKLREMKSKLNGLIDEVTKKTEELINNYEPSILIRRDNELRKQPSSYDPMYGSETDFLHGYTIKTELEYFIKKEVGCVGALLKEFDYKVFHGFSEDYKDEFEVKHEKGNSVIIYKNKGRKLKLEIIEEFGNTFSEISRIIDSNIKLEKEISQKNAEKLWDSI